MFFPDPGKVLREMFRALRVGGRASVMVFSTPDQNTCVSILTATALKHAGLSPRDRYQAGGLLSLGKPGLLDEIFRQAGLSPVGDNEGNGAFPVALCEGLSRFHPHFGESDRAVSGQP